MTGVQIYKYREKKCKAEIMGKRGGDAYFGAMSRMGRVAKIQIHKYINSEKIFKFKWGGVRVAVH